MSFELTMNRVMALCDAAELAPEDTMLTGAPLVDRFRKQMQHMYVGYLPSAYEAIYKAAYKARIQLTKVEAPVSSSDDEEDIDITVMPPDSPDLPRDLRPLAREHFIGLFRSNYFSMKVDSLEWLLRIRPSATACSLERADGFAKLWWTFEGVPKDPDLDVRPSQKQAADFIGVTNEFAKAGLPALRDAYFNGLNQVTSGVHGGLELRPERIRVSLSDNDGKPFAALVDAMNMKGATFNEAYERSVFGNAAAEGAAEVSEFIKLVSGPAETYSRVELNTSVPLAKGVICDVKVKSGTSTEYVVAGLARSHGMRGGYLTQPVEFRRLEHQPSYLRSISAARPLSAVLAMNTALRMDHQLAHNAPMAPVLRSEPKVAFG